MQGSGPAFGSGEPRQGPYPPEEVAAASRRFGRFSCIPRRTPANLGPVNEAHAAHEKAYADGIAELNGNSTWSSLRAEDQARILLDVGLNPPVKGDVSSDEALLASLDSRPLVARQAEADAVVNRIARALEQAARLLEPKVQMTGLERATLRTEQDVRDWVARQEKLLLAAIKRGPVWIHQSVHLYAKMLLCVPPLIFLTRCTAN